MNLGLKSFQQLHKSMFSYKVEREQKSLSELITHTTWQWFAALSRKKDFVNGFVEWNFLIFFESFFLINNNGDVRELIKDKVIKGAHNDVVLHPKNYVTHSLWSTFFSLR